jgi:hypothetical protein
MSFLEKLHPFLRTPGEQEPNIAYFVARLGGEGERWAEEYTRPEHVEIMAGTNRALAALRARRIETGRREMEAVEKLFHANEGATSPEVHHLLGRWYFGALAYLHYCAEDLPQAEEALDRAAEEVRRAIQIRRFLLPYATECCEFWVQRIRVARNHRRWSTMWRNVEITRQIVDSERPCCVLDDGTGIGFPDVREFYSRFTGLTEEERRPLRWVLEEESWRRRFRSIVGEIYGLSGFVIPYTPAADPA